MLLIFLPSLRVYAADSPTPTPTTVEGYAECDMCGYCPKNYPTPPGNWKDCVACLYPTLYPVIKNTITKDTLKVDQSTQNAPTPNPGHMYTMLGCIKSDLGSFTSDGAAASVVQVLLDFIFRIVGAIAFLYIIYGAYLVLTSQADPERLGRGRQTLYGAIAGLVFVLMAVFIVRFLASGVLKIPGFG